MKDIAKNPFHENNILDTVQDIKDQIESAEYIERQLSKRFEVGKPIEFLEEPIPNSTLELCSMIGLTVEYAVTESENKVEIYYKIL